MARKATGTRFLKFGDKERAAYLELREQGVGKLNAASGVGVSPDTVRQYAAANPGWDDLDREAASKANQHVENALFQAAKKGSVAACCAWLYNRDPENWKDRRKPSDVPDDTFDISRLSTDERAALQKAIDKAIGPEAESGSQSSRRNGILPHASNGVC